MARNRDRHDEGGSPQRHGGAWLAGALGVLLLAACGGADDAPPARAEALASARPGEVVAYVRERLRQRAQQREALPGIEFDGRDLPPIVVAGGDGGEPVLRSSTTVQEAGVDEDDLVKTDGALIYTLDTRADDSRAATLVAHRRLGDGGIETAATLELPADAGGWPMTRGMLLAEGARRIAVIGEAVSIAGGTDPCEAADGCLGRPAILPAPMIASTRAIVQLVDAAADGGLAAATRHALDGRLVGARLVGDRLVVVTSHVPQLPADQLPPDTPVAEREAAYAALTADAVLPQRHTGAAGAAPLVGETDCWLQTANASEAIEITTISVFDLAAPGAAPASRCIVGGSEALYLAADATLVLATTRVDYREVVTGDVGTIYPPKFSTDLHRFVLGQDGAGYRASGSVEGHLGWDNARKPYRISAHRGDIRVLGFTGESGWASVEDATTSAPSPATLTILRDDGAGRLVVVSTLPNERRPQALGKPGEQVHGVRFAGDRGYLVTFRQVDPLYVLDLADPADPKVAGALEVPGFSDHLFPLDGGLLLGVGHDVDADGVRGGVKVALFDTRDAAAPALIDSRNFGGFGSASGLDAGPHGIGFLGVGGMVRIAMPMLEWGDGGATAYGLQRFEVDTVARTLAVLTRVPAPGDVVDFGAERSVQIGDHGYYWTGAVLTPFAWSRDAAPAAVRGAMARR